MLPVPNVEVPAVTDTAPAPVTLAGVLNAIVDVSWSVAPDAIVNDPVWVPPGSRSVPVMRSTSPGEVLLNEVVLPMLVAAVPPDFRNVPVLLIVLVPPLGESVKSASFWMSQVPPF